MSYKAKSQAILLILNELEKELNEVEQNGIKKRTVDTEIYEKLKETLIQASNHFEDLADVENK